MLLVQLQGTGAGSRGRRSLSAAMGLARHVRAEGLACLVCPQRPVALRIPNCGCASGI